MTTSPRRASVVLPLQFVALALTWGSSFLLVTLGLEGLSPGQVVLARLVFGALALTGIMAVTRRTLPRDPRVWWHLAVVGALLCTVPFLLFAWAQQHVTSGLASIYNATTPLQTTLVAALALPTERLTRGRATWVLLGFAGVLTVLGPWRGLDTGGGLLAQAACLAATACYGMAFVYLRRFVSGRGLDAVTTAFGQVVTGTLLLLLTLPVTAMEPVDLSPRVLASMLVLGAVGTGLAYVWNANIVAGWGATSASTVTYLTPVVGVALGAAVLGERVTWNQPVGAALVVAGIAVAQGRLRRAARWPVRHGQATPGAQLGQHSRSLRRR